MKSQLKLFSAVVMMLISPVVVSAAGSDIVVSHSKIGKAAAPYVGVSLGSAGYDLANDSSPSFSIFGGMALNELLAVELGVVDFGDVSPVGSKSKASALHGSVMANFEFSNELAGFVQVGLASWDYDFGALNDSSVDVFWGAGLNYDIGHNLGARFAIQQFSMDASFPSGARNENILNVNFGLLYKF